MQIYYHNFSTTGKNRKFGLKLQKRYVQAKNCFLITEKPIKKQ